MAQTALVPSFKNKQKESDVEQKCTFKVTYQIPGLTALFFLGICSGSLTNQYKAEHSQTHIFKEIRIKQQ